MLVFSSSTVCLSLLFFFFELKSSFAFLFACVSQVYHCAIFYFNKTLSLSPFSYFLFFVFRFFVTSAVRLWLSTHSHKCAAHWRRYTISVLKKKFSILVHCCFSLISFFHECSMRDSIYIHFLSSNRTTHWTTHIQ